MSLTRLALKFAVPAVKLEAYRRYLFIGPHPDDIEIGAGATAAKLAAAIFFEDETSGSLRAIDVGCDHGKLAIYLV